MKVEYFIILICLFIMKISCGKLTNSQEMPHVYYRRINMATIKLPWSSDCDFMNTEGFRKQRICLQTDNHQRPKGHNCLISVYGFDLKYIGVWTCELYFEGHLNPSFYYTELYYEVKDPEVPKGELITTKEGYKLTCKIENTWCKALRPDKNYVLIWDGVNESNYNNTALKYKTFKNESECSVFISKPLNLINKGLWLIQGGKSSMLYTGCFFNVPNNNINKTSQITKIKKTIYIPYNSDYEFNCSVPWPINYCYVSNPNKEITPSETVTAKYVRTVGICKVKVEKITEPGIYNCIVSSELGTNDLAFSTEVKLLSTLIIPEKDYYYANINSTIFIQFNYKHSKDLQSTHINCTPPKPNNRYTFMEKNGKPKKLTLMLKNVQPEDKGIWICQIAVEYVKFTLILQPINY